MKVYLQAAQIEIAFLIAEELKDKGHSCECFKSLSDLFSNLKNSINHPDLIASDFTAFNHDYYNPNTSLLSDNILTPVIYYNDPCLTRSSRSKHWMDFIANRQFQFPVNSDEELYYKSRTEKYGEIFLQLEEIVESDLLRPYIPLMQEPKPLPVDLTISYLQRLKNNCHDYNIMEFKLRTSLPQNLYNLLIIFYERKNSIIELKDLCLIYSKRVKEVSQESMKSLISQLKHYIKEDKTAEFTIEHRDSGYIFLSQVK